MFVYKIYIFFQNLEGVAQKLSLPRPFILQNSKGRGRPNFWARPSKFWKNIYFLKINKWCYHDILVSLLVSDLKKMTRTFLSRLQSSLLYITLLHIFRYFVMNMQRNGTKWYHNQSGLLWTLFFICKKQSPGGAAVGKFRKIFKKPWYLHYLTAFRGGMGIKSSGIVQGLWICCPFALKFDCI